VVPTRKAPSCLKIIFRTLRRRSHFDVSTAAMYSLLISLASASVEICSASSFEVNVLCGEFKELSGFGQFNDVYSDRSTCDACETQADLSLHSLEILRQIIYHETGLY
jgi:hypothetical protein